MAASANDNRRETGDPGGMAAVPSPVFAQRVLAGEGAA
jgi:hypothetical protein